MPQSEIDQAREIEELVDDALEMLDQVRYSLKMLEERLMKHSKARKADESTSDS